MRILFTGASSFTGYWFVRELTGTRPSLPVVATAATRVCAPNACGGCANCARLRFDCAFGNDDFLALTKTPSDVLCNHGAEVGDYRSPDFDPYRAAAANLHRLPEVLRALKDRGAGVWC